MTAPNKYDVQVTFKGKPNTKDLEEFSEADINRLLATLPETIYKYGIEVVRTMEEFEAKKRVTKLTLAKYASVASLNREKLGLSSEKDRTAYAMSQKPYQDAESEEVDAKIAHELAKLRHEFTENLFTAVRKAANLKEQQIKNEADAQRYTQPR